MNFSACCNTTPTQILENGLEPVSLVIKEGRLRLFKHVERRQALDVLLLCETWHDADSVSIRRLRADGFTVVERARPRRHHDVSVNHGGVAIIATASIKLTAVTIGVQPTTFECVAARVMSGISSCVLLSVYRPGSSAVTASFFSELADVLDRFSTYVEPLVLAGDINIRLERSTDPHAVEFRELLDSCGQTQHVQDVTHDEGGILVVVCTRSDLPSPSHLMSS